jgi:hypothetical protein
MAFQDQSPKHINSGLYTLAMMWIQEAKQAASVSCSTLGSSTLGPDFAVWLCCRERRQQLLRAVQLQPVQPRWTHLQALPQRYTTSSQHFPPRLPQPSRSPCWAPSRNPPEKPDHLFAQTQSHPLHTQGILSSTTSSILATQCVTCQLSGCTTVCLICISMGMPAASAPPPSFLARVPSYSTAAVRYGSTSNTGDRAVCHRPTRSSIPHAAAAP